MIKIKKIEETDITEVIRLLQPFVAQGIVLERSFQEIKNDLHCFFLALVDERVAGVVAYHDYDKHLFEVRSLVVSEEFMGRGVGRALVWHVVSLLREQYDDSRIFALTYVPKFFLKLNFEPVDKSYFPEKIWKDCNNCPRKDCCTETALINRG